MVKNILFDFDGVILDSMPIRAFGFRKIFEEFDHALVDKLIEFHEVNGGLSRFVKIRFFFETLLQRKVDADTVGEYAEKFSKIMKKELVDRKYLIKDTLDFIESNYHNYNLHIVSGSEQNELKFLCKALGVDIYFESIHGSPTPKNDLVDFVLKDNCYQKKETLLIGDSINDYDAAKINNIGFYGVYGVYGGTLSEELFTQKISCI